MIDETFNRIVAELNMGEYFANCEDCGEAIPIEYAKCRKCEVSDETGVD